MTRASNQQDDALSSTLDLQCGARSVIKTTRLSNRWRERVLRDVGNAPIGCDGRIRVGRRTGRGLAQGNIGTGVIGTLGPNVASRFMVAARLCVTDAGVGELHRNVPIPRNTQRSIQRPHPCNGLDDQAEGRDRSERGVLHEARADIISATAECKPTVGLHLDQPHVRLSLDVYRKVP